MERQRLGYAAALLWLVVQISPVLAQTQTRRAFLPETRLWVEGTSTLKSWSCEAGEIEGYLDIALPASNADAVTLLSTLSGVELAMPVAGLDCKNDAMHKKLQHALRAEAQPVIRYELVRVDALVPSETEQGVSALLVTGRLRLAGLERTLQTRLEAHVLPDGRLHFEGSQTVQMNDFGIDPPTALLGTLKTGESVTVYFMIAAAALPEM